MGSQGRARSSARGVARAVYLAPRNATDPHHAAPHLPQALADRPQPRAPPAAHAGRADARQPGPASSRIVRPARKILKAKVTADKLARVYPTVSPSTARIQAAPVQAPQVLQELRRRRRPARLPDADRPLPITNKQVNPAWTAPNSPWAGELAGTTTPGGSAANPLKARWMGIVNGVGIHGTVAGVLDRQPRLARLHPHARRRRDRPVSAGAGRHPGPDPLTAARSTSASTSARPWSRATDTAVVAVAEHVAVADPVDGHRRQLEPARLGHPQRLPARRRTSGRGGSRGSNSRALDSSVVAADRGDRDQLHAELAPLRRSPAAPRRRRRARGRAAPAAARAPRGRSAPRPPPPARRGIGSTTSSTTNAAAITSSVPSAPPTNGAATSIARHMRPPPRRAGRAPHPRFASSTSCASDASMPSATTSRSGSAS